MLRIHILLVALLSLIFSSVRAQSKYFTNTDRSSFKHSVVNDGELLEVYDRKGDVVFKKLIPVSPKNKGVLIDVSCFEDGAVSKLVVLNNNYKSGQHFEERYFFDRSGCCYQQQTLKDGIPVQLEGVIQY